MLSPHAPNPARGPLAKLMAEYERTNTVKTAPIIARDNPSSKPPGADRARERANARKK